MKYTKTFRDSILRKVLPPENRSVSSVSKEMGVAVVTINCWLAKLKNGTLSLEEDGGAGCRNANEKLNLLLEYQKVTAENEGEWLRQREGEGFPLYIKNKPTTPDYSYHQEN